MDAAILVTIDADLTGVPPDTLVQNLSPARREKATRMRRPEGIWRILAGEFAVRTLLKRYAPQLTPELTYDDAGAPLFFPACGWECSISHAGPYVAALLSNAPCGIDIERHRSIDVKAGRHIFSATDMLRVVEAPQTEQNTLFFKTWALKESLAKWQRTGISASLRDFSVEPVSDSRWRVLHTTHKNLNGFELEAPAGFTMAVVVESAGKPDLLSATYPF